MTLVEARQLIGSVVIAWLDWLPLKLFLSYLRNWIKPLPLLEHPDGAAGVDSAPSTTTGPKARESALC